MAAKDEFLRLKTTVDDIDKALKKWRKTESDTQYTDKGFGVNLRPGYAGVEIAVRIDSWRAEAGKPAEKIFALTGINQETLFREAFLDVLNRRLIGILEDTADFIRFQAVQEKEAYLKWLNEEEQQVREWKTERVKKA